MINKLQGYLVGDIIQTPKRIVKPSGKITMAEARINIKKMFERTQERNARKKCKKI